VLVKTESGASIRLSVLNRHPTLDWKADCAFAGFKIHKAEVHEMYSDDLSAVVSADDTLTPLSYSFRISPE
jgi:alpha-N-arabinofuranosidase